MEGFAVLHTYSILYPGSKSCKWEILHYKNIDVGCCPAETSNLLWSVWYIQQCDSAADDTIYKYKAKTLNGSCTVNFSGYTGKTVLFVNVATYWGLTYQYVGKKLHHRHRVTEEINKLLCKTFNCLSFIFGHQNWMHYTRRWNPSDSPSSAFPATSLENRNQGKTMKFCQL